MPASPIEHSGNSAAAEPANDGSAGQSARRPAGIDSALGDLIEPIELALAEACEFGAGCPRRLGEAIRYALLAPGKRLRPALVLMAGEACGADQRRVMPGAVAVEMIHAYSLIHDDLPAMDDDDLRRGRPTVHIQFDEATAILAGDALQPLAIAHLCRNVAESDVLAEAVRVLATAAGPEHLVGGQADDLAAELGQLPNGLEIPAAGSLAGDSARANNSAGDFDTSDQTNTQRCLDFLESVHRRKTGALFAASLELGAVLGGATPDQREALAAYASDVGLAFQVVDDLLDHTADATQMGKRTQKDADRGKLTYPGLLGVDRTRHLAAQLITSAKQPLEVFGTAAWRLNELADYVLSRSH